jgi:hypothetical protein
MSSAQIAGLILVLVFLGTILHMVRRGRLRAKYSFLWMIVGTVILIFSAIPGLLDSVALAVGIYYPPALLFLGATMLLLFLAVHFSWELTRLEARTRTLTEELALTNARIDELHPAEARSIDQALSDSLPG